MSPDWGNGSTSWVGTDCVVFDRLSDDTLRKLVNDVQTQLVAHCADKVSYHVDCEATTDEYHEPPVSIQSTLQAETDVFLRGA